MLKPQKILLLFCTIFFIHVDANASATMISGTSQKIKLNTIPKSADVFMNKQKICTTPCEYSLDKGYENLRLTFIKKNYKPKTILLKTRVDTLSAYGFIFSSTDQMSGAMYEYSPDTFLVELEHQTITSKLEKTQKTQQKELNQIKTTQKTMQKNIAQNSLNHINVNEVLQNHKTVILSQKKEHQNLQNKYQTLAQNQINITHNQRVNDELNKKKWQETQEELNQKEYNTKSWQTNQEQQNMRLWEQVPKRRPPLMKSRHQNYQNGYINIPKKMRNIARYQQNRYSKMGNKREVEELKQRAMDGDAVAMLNIGYMYVIGDFVLQNYSKAKYWLQKAYDDGDDEVANKASSLWERYELWRY